jgi:hypothetical protein
MSPYLRHAARQLVPMAIATLGTAPAAGSPWRAHAPDRCQRDTRVVNSTEVPHALALPHNAIRVQPIRMRNRSVTDVAASSAQRQISRQWTRVLLPQRRRQRLRLPRHVLPKTPENMGAECDVKQQLQHAEHALRPHSQVELCDSVRLYHSNHFEPAYARPRGSVTQCTQCHSVYTQTNPPRRVQQTPPTTARPRGSQRQRHTE